MQVRKPSKKHFAYLVSPLLLATGYLVLLNSSTGESHVHLESMRNVIPMTISTTSSSSTTVTVPAPPPTTMPRASRYKPVTQTARAPRFTGDIWQALGNCESHNTNDHYAPFYGYFQFSESTWHGIGESGLPDQYPYETQLAAAKRLQARSGWGQWPVCSRKLGLR